MNQHEEALQSYNKALALKSDTSGASYDRKDVLNNRGNLLRGLKRYEEAIDDYGALFEADPDYPFNRGALFYARAECCDWAGFERETHALSAGVRARKPLVRPFAFFAFSDSAADQLRCAQVYVENRCPPSPMPLWAGERYDHDRIRVAYVSADFHTHPMAFLMAGLFERHDRSRFETIAISFGPDEPGEMRTRLENAFDRFINLREAGSTEIAKLIRELEVDIAIDRKGYTQNARPEIFAQRPAPVQAAWLAFPGTVGADYMDYILADRHVIPEDQQQYYTEKVVYLPDTYQANDSTRPIAEQTPSRTEAGLPDTAFVFCSFNANYKINPPVFDIWMHLLNHVKGSVLWLLESNPAAARNLRREAEMRGVAPERLVFAPHIDNADHLARHRLADLFLDTLPFNAHTTASDALWAGLPVLTCIGTTFAGRVAASLLNAIGLPELVTHSLEDYEALALTLAQDGNALAALKSKLARNRLTHPLFDTDRMRRHVEAAYEAMWQRHQRRQPPAEFTVPSIDD
jgi:predicted O-linked N-acetylglucosamine transferase (SPINDLY family)